MYYARKIDGYFKRKSFFLKFVVFEKKTFRQFHLPPKFETYIEGSALKLATRKIFKFSISIADRIIPLEVTQY